MKIHFALTCLSFFFFGIGMTVQQFGIKAGLGFWPTVIIFSASLIFYTIVVFTSMQKVKEKLFGKPKDEKTFEFENKKQ